MDVARCSGVSAGTVSNVFNHPERVAEDKRQRVEAAADELGFVRYGLRTQFAAHWRRNGFATWTFQPAVTGWYPKKAGQEARPVPVVPDPWPRHTAARPERTGRAEACWAPSRSG